MIRTYRAVRRMPIRPSLERLEDRLTPSSMTFIATATNTLYQDTNPTSQLSDGAGLAVVVGNSNHSVIHRGLVKFDISSIPAGSTITGATLTLQLSKAAGGVSATPEMVTAHRVLADWGEGTSKAGTGGSGPGSGEGEGAPATTGDATWLDTFYSTSNPQTWTTPGGNFAAGSASTTVSTLGSYQWSSSGMVADVQSWLNNPGTSFGWALTGTETVGGSPASGTALEFNSSNPSNGTLRPSLTVTFTTAPPPVPDLTIAKSHTGNFTQGDASDTYTITVTNVGTGPTSGTVTMIDTLPTGLTPTPADNGTIDNWTVSASGQTITATRSDVLAAGKSYDLLPLTVAVPLATPPGTLTNTATVAGGGETNTTNDTANDPTTIVAAPPDLTISKSHVGNFTQGDSSDTYTITVSNVGTGPTSGTVTMIDTLPTGLTPTAADNGTINNWTVSASGQTITATRSDVLAAGNSYDPLPLTVAVDFATPTGTVTNTATVSGGGETNTSNDSASDPTNIDAFTGPNQPPVNTLPASYSGTQETGTVTLTRISVADPDAGSASEQVSFTVSAGTLTLSTSVSGGVTANEVTGNGTASLSVTAPLAVINATLADPAGLVFTPPEDGATITLTMATDDLGHTGTGGAQTTTSTSTINLAPIPEPPAVTIPPTGATPADTPLPLTGISIAQEDVSANPIAIVLSASNGTLALSTSVTGGVTAAQVTANGSDTVLVFSTLAQIDATLAAANGVVFPPAGAFAGTATVTVVVNDMGNNDTGAPLSGTGSESITVTRVVDHYTVAVPSTAVAGVPFTVTLTARDLAGNTVSNYTGTALITDGDPLGQLPAQVIFSAGVAQFSATFETAGTQTLTAFDSAASSVSGSATVAVSPGAPAKLTFVQPPVNTLAGAPFLTPVSVAVVDAFGNIVTADNHDVVSVRLQSNPTKALLSGTTTAPVVHGVAAFPGLQLLTAGTGFTLLASGPVLPIAISSPFNAVAIAGFTVTTTQTTAVTAGSQVSITVQAVSSTGAVVTGYPGVVHFTSTDPQAVLPPDAPLTSGLGTFTVTLKTAGTRSISVTDVTKPTLTGALKKPLTVVPAAVAGFNVTGLAFPSMAGQKQMITITAVDAFGNLVPSFQGTVTLSSTDAAAVFVPASVKFTTANAGKQTALVTLKTPGLETVSATDGSLTGSDANVPVAGTTPTVQLQPDPLSPTKFALVVIGVPGNNTISIFPTSADGTQLEVDVGGVSQGSFFAPTGHLLVYGLSGNDTIRLSPGKGALSNVKVAIPSLIYGGAGNNTLDASGSSQPAILVGGPGNDTLTGSGANSILIGGLGTDVLRGGAGDTILIPGATAFDTNAIALLQLMQEWQNSSTLFLTRVQHLTGSLAGGANFPFLLNSATIQKDTAIEQLFAGGGHSWFFFNSGAPGQVIDPMNGDILIGL